jgi:sugar (glycoside-pentoside-hexuronide) transporter
MSEKLKQSTKLVFGFGDFGNSIAFSIILFLYLNYLTDHAGISPAVAGTILLAGKAWDAIVDPLIGQRSDQTISKMGRRRPFFLFSSLPFAAFFFLLWNVPDTSPTFKIVFVVLSFLAFITFFSLIQIPYSSLTAQLTQDYDERTNLTGYRMAFSIIGGLIASVIPLAIIKQYSVSQTGYSIMGLIFGAVILLSPLALFFFIKEQQIEKQTEELSFFQGIKEVFKNKPFIPAILLFLFASMAIDATGTIMIYYTKYWLNRESQTYILLGIVFVTAALFLPVWYKVSVAIGKIKSYILGSIFMIISFTSLFFLARDDNFLLYIIAFFIGVGISMAHLIPWAIFPDVIEYDEMKTGKRREGIYYGFGSFLRQLSTSGVIFVAGIALEVSGFVPNVEQSRSSLLAIRFLAGVFPSILVLCGIISIFFYPITKETHTRILRVLEKKRLRNEIRSH